MKKINVSVVGLILFYITPCLGQSRQVVQTEISPNDHAQNFTFLPDGFYWYGNSSGLHRFDGQQSTRYLVKDAESDISHDQFVASDIYQDQNAQYWFSTYQALHRLDPLSGRFKTFGLYHKDERINVGNVVFHLDSVREEILIKADTSIFAFNTIDFTYRLLKDEIRSNSLYPVHTKNATLFFGAPWWNAKGIEYFEYHSGGVTDFQRINLPVMVKAIAPFTKDSLYLATPEGFQLLTKPLDAEKRRLTTIITGEARTITLDKASGSVYVSIDKLGVFRFSPKENRITQHWSIKDGLSTNDIRTLAVDDKGNVITSSLTEGVDIITVTDHRIAYAQLDDFSEISDITRLTNGDVLSINKQGRIYRKKSKSQVALKEDQKQIPGLINAKIGYSSTGEIFAHGMSNMVTFTSGGAITKIQKRDVSIYSGVIAFDDGEKLVLSNQGIISMKGDSLPEFLPGAPHGPNDFFSYLIKLSENRFLASYRQVALWDFKRTGKGWEVVNEIPIPGETQAAVLYGDKLFLGTSAGLLLLDQDSLTTIFNPTTTGNLWINALHKDTKNRLWLGTEQGLFCYYPETGEHLYFSEADGITDDWFIRANVIANDSTFIMATKTGLVTIDTRLADATTSDNKTYLSDIWVNGIRQTDHSLYDPQPLDLDYQHNAVSFLPGMIELSSSELSGFRYRLEGLEEDFIYSKAGEVIRYPSIPPGDYSFQFMGVDKNGRTTESISLLVTISPPFYQTWWFWTLCGVSAMALLYTLNQRAINQETTRQKTIQKEEARKAAETLARHQAVVSEQRRIMMELHDDLGGTLGSLFYTLDGYLLDKESGLPVQPDFELLKNTSGDAMKQLREVMRGNVAREMALPVFVRTLTEQARAVATASRLEWELEKDNSFPDLQLSSQQVHNALLIFKEAMQNIRKHAQATAFTLKLHLAEEQNTTLVITLVDDGVGLPPKATALREDGTGNGLRNMQRRAEDLDGELVLTSLPEGGTSLQLSFPVN